MWAATGRWWIYPLLWWLPWMTQWRVINRLRAIAEHGGLRGAARTAGSPPTTCASRWLARFWFVPYNTGWHLAHHVDMGVPFRNLPAFHAELERAGYVTEGTHLPQLPLAVEGAGLGLTGPPAAVQATAGSRAAQGPVPTDQSAVELSCPERSGGRRRWSGPGPAAWP